MRRLTIVTVLCLTMTAAAAWARVIPGPLKAASPPWVVSVHAKAKPGHAKPATVLLGRKTIRRGLHQDIAAGRAEAFRFEETMAGMAQQISVYVPAQTTATTLLAGLYSDKSGSPGSLLTSGSAPVPMAGGWTTVAVKSRQVTKDTVYWIAVLGKGGVLDPGAGRDASCRSATAGRGGLATLPQPWAPGTRSRYCISAYVSGQPLGDGSTTGTGTSPIANAPSPTDPPGDPAPVSVPTLPTLAPVNTAAPAITGTAQQGSTLTASTGSWTGSPTSYSYQWQDCTLLCSNIANATGPSYTLTSSDVGDTIDAVVTAANAGGSTSAASGRTSIVQNLPAPVNTAAPAISGASQQGQTLTASNGSWSNNPSSYGYQWQDCTSASSCTNISGATSSTYVLKASDVGDTIDVAVTATNAGGSTKATSARTQAVTGLPAPVNTAAPAISGASQQGQTLTASNGSWSNNPSSYGYQWQDCTSASSCTNISGATSSTYVLKASDVGDTIDVAVTATNAGGSTKATSARTQAVTGLPAPVNTAAPAISGASQQGQTLTASNGSWSNNPSSYGYQWQDCTSASSCTNISGATSSTYVLKASDVGDTIDVAVMATNAGGSTKATSARTQAVTASSGGNPLSPLRVSGSHLVDGGGQQVALHGVDVSGSSYACEQNGGFGFSDTPTGDALYAPMRSNGGGKLPRNWTINSVTLGLNQDCWLGINGVPAKYSGQNYVNYVKSEVASMEKYGIYPVLAFFVGEPGTDTPNWNSTGNGNAPMPDNDHVPLFWEEMASTFKNDPDVIFRLYEEPWPESNSASLSTWKCWSQGDVQYGTGSDNTPPTPPTPVSSNQNCNPLNSDAQGTSYRAVGMQSLINIIRGTGATNIIQVPGVAFANMLACSNTGSPTSCGFLDSADGIKVNDTLSPAQLMADTDNYPDNGQECGTMTCVNDTYDPVAAVMPVDFGEIGGGNTYAVTESFVAHYDSLGQSYYGSQWETWSGFITNYNGTPGAGFPTWFYNDITGANCSVSSGC